MGQHGARPPQAAGRFYFRRRHGYNPGHPPILKSEKGTKGYDTANYLRLLRKLVGRLLR
jgi:hypothetical protein